MPLDAEFATILTTRLQDAEARLDDVARELHELHELVDVETVVDPA